MNHNKANISKSQYSSRKFKNVKNGQNELTPRISKLLEIENLFSSLLQSKSNGKHPTKVEKFLKNLSQSNVTVLIVLIIFILNMYYLLSILNR